MSFGSNLINTRKKLLSSSVTMHWLIKTLTRVSKTTTNKSKIDTLLFPRLFTSVAPVETAELGPTKSGEKPRVVVLGSGWAGCKLMKDIETSIYDVVCVSPRNHMVFTPLLASTCVGTLEFRSVAEHIGRIQPAEPGSYLFLANCTALDTQKHQGGIPQAQLVRCMPHKVFGPAKSTGSSTFVCGICADHKPLKKSFSIKGCTHSYCSDCVCEYVISKIQNKITRISCPVSGCNGSLDPEHCRSILGPKVLDKWGDYLCEALISASDKFYCPFKDCSALLVKGPDFKDIVESECPICHKLFCANCMVPWHSGIKCRKFQKLHKEEGDQKNDILLKQLAKKKRWTKCSKCKLYVERTEGCLFMRCRCGYTFCYNCGARLKSHYCKKCMH